MHMNPSSRWRTFPRPLGGKLPPRWTMDDAAAVFGVTRGHLHTTLGRVQGSPKPVMSHRGAAKSRNYYDSVELTAWWNKVCADRAEKGKGDVRHQ